MAWARVRESALRSESIQTRSEARAFELKSSSGIRSLLARLSREQFRFLPARGVVISKKNGNAIKKRPVVIAPIESRIVQRAILDVVQDIPQIKSALHAGFNFGGIDGAGFGVPGAIAKAVLCAQRGGYFVRTDIKAFFTAVPRNQVVNSVCEHFAGDSKFEAIFRSAVETEIQDACEYGEDLKLFPLFEEGVAQGSCLSPLLCNYLLRDFDRAMNDRGVVCIRYIDDFILFARDRKTALKAFQSALELLRTLGLTAYDPFSTDGIGKAEHGQADAGFSFLGCEVYPNRVRPSAEKVDSLIAKVDGLLQGCIEATRDPQQAIHSLHQVSTFSGSILAASNVIRAWGNTYSFCSDDRLTGTIDARLSASLKAFRKKFTERIQALDADGRRRSLGLFFLADCNKADDVPQSARSLALQWSVNTS